MNCLNHTVNHDSYPLQTHTKSTTTFNIKNFYKIALIYSRTTRVHHIVISLSPFLKLLMSSLGVCPF